MQAMGTKPVSEYITADGLFAIDIALWARGATRIAVEVDGPSHFAVNDLEHVTGQTLARRHALERLGWVVVSVPLPLWVQLRGHAEKEEWLREQLLLATRSGTAAVSAAQRAGHGRPQSAQQAQRRVCHAEQQGVKFNTSPCAFEQRQPVSTRAAWHLPEVPDMPFPAVHNPAQSPACSPLLCPRFSFARPTSSRLKQPVDTFKYSTI